MATFFDRLKAGSLRHRGELLSAAVHGGLVLCLVGSVGHSAQVVPYRLPGTAMGDTALVFYAPGSYRPVSSTTPLKSKERLKIASKQEPKPSAQSDAVTQSAQAHAGTGTATESGLGEGDVKIALETYFPFPKPDLTGLPHGTRGDVILDAVIDEHGRISTLTLLKGLGSPVDESVMATVQQWQYTPAMKNGVPVASERELHFHYERG
jgi:periplasmic protein TonB